MRVFSKREQLYPKALRYPTFNFSQKNQFQKERTELRTHLNKIAKNMWEENFSSLIFDVKEKVSGYGPLVNQCLHSYGYIILKNTGFNCYESMLSFLDDVGMTKERSFEFGGRTSETKQAKWVHSNRVRQLDFYPGSHYLLPNPECQYMSFFPQHIIFYCPKSFEPDKGGRTFIHSTKGIENYISKFSLGQKLLDDIKIHNLKISTGFLEENHPCKAKNYFKSIEEKFKMSCEDVCKMIKEGQLIEEFFDGRILTKEGGKVLLASITMPGFRKFKEEYYLNLPRIAMTPPSIENGFREYSLGNGRLLTDDENLLLLEAYLSTREEVNWKKGDLVIFNNITHVHSKEPHAFEQWPVVVAMDGVAFSELLSAQQQEQIKNKFNISKAQVSSLDKKETAYGRFATEAVDYNDGRPRYTMPEAEKLWRELFPTRVFDAKEQLRSDHPNRSLTIRQIASEFKKYGIVNVINAGTPEPVYDQETIGPLGFSEKQIFKWGGKISGRTFRKPLEKYGKYGFYSVDTYPAEKVLLPHNEIYYQHELPRSLMFIYVQTSPEWNGGRTLLHSSDLVEKYIESRGEIGRKLLQDMEERGMYIESGFADENHPEASKLYTRTWQERFGTKDVQEAINIIKDSPNQFDQAWVREEEPGDRKKYYTLMTSITVPCFNHDELTNKKYMMFPRIAYNRPEFENGYRVYKLGSKDGDNGKDLTKEQIQILIEAFFLSRLGRYQNEGDFILCDNLQYSHSRESFNADFPRTTGVQMAGLFRTKKFKEAIN